jgi:hypothetical protein
LQTSRLQTGQVYGISDLYCLPTITDVLALRPSEMPGSVTLCTDSFRCGWRMVRHQSGPYSHFGGRQVVTVL